jgi:acetyl esterase/lipase
MPGRHRAARRVLTGLLAVLLLAGLAAAGLLAYARYQQIQVAQRQEKLASFYTIPSPLPAGSPGRLLRAQRVSFAPQGSQGWRVLFESQGPDGEATVSSGMVFAPSTAPPPGGRPVVVWAHGTAGMGVQCAPSRSANPLAQLDWLGGMLARGWVVTAPDYAGLGTPGVMRFLVGAPEGMDLLNSVRAARSLDHSGAGSRFALWGHSQGGQSVLFAAQMASSYAPELQLVAASVAAPAAQLVPLIREQYANALAWAIGPEVAVAWPATYADLRPEQVMTPAALRTYRQVAELCVLVSGVEGILREDLLGQRFFATDPTSVPAWSAALVANTVPLPPTGLPVYLAQGLADQVILPNTTALLEQRYCSAHVPLSAEWMGGVGHVKVATAAGPQVTAWLADRFAGSPAATSCADPPPVSPAAL